MSQQAQIFILKQGSWQKDSWSSRILTVDTNTATATVSRRSQPSKILYHTLHVTEFRKFPHVDLAHTKVDPDSIEAKWTLCLLGNKVPVPQLDTEMVNDAVPYQKENIDHAEPTSAREKQSPDSADTPTSANKSVKKTNSRMRKAGQKACEQWLIQCTSPDTYDLVVKLLEHIVETKE